MCGRLKPPQDKSYGIHVARLAGLPRSIIRRASECCEPRAIIGCGGHAEAGVAEAPQEDRGRSESIDVVLSSKRTIHGVHDEDHQLWFIECRLRLSLAAHCLARETLASSSMQVNPGGKGANQSVAMIRAARRYGMQGWARYGMDARPLAKEGIDVRHIKVRVLGGHAIIQVDERSRTASCCTAAQYHYRAERIHEVLADAGLPAIGCAAERNQLDAGIAEAGKARNEGVLQSGAIRPRGVRHPLDCVDLFILNEHEALAGKRPVDTARNPADELAKLIRRRRFA